jgi:hypothetical protein
VPGPVLGNQFFGTAQVPVRLPEELRTRHLYIIGRSGSGKTTLIRNLVLHDLAAGHGLAVIAPEAELVFQELPPFVPRERFDDVIVVDPADPHPVSLNPLHLAQGEDLDLKVGETLSIFRRLFEEGAGGGAPRIETILRQGLCTHMQLPGSTLLAFSGEVHVARKPTAHVLRDPLDMVYRMLSDVCQQRGRIDEEIGAMKARIVTNREAHHVMVEAIRCRAISAAKLPKVLREWERPQHAEFEPRTAWSLLNAFTEVQKGASPRLQMDGSLKLALLFRRELSLN